MPSSAAHVDDYLAALPPDRRSALEAVRAVLREHLDPAFEEGMQYGMIGYYVPHRLFPAGYHTDPRQPLPFLALAAQKQNMALYLMHLYADPTESAWFRSAWLKSGKKLDMGKSCLRFRRVEDLALDVLGAALERVTAKAYIERYLEQRQAQAAKGTSKKPAPKKKAPKKKAKAR